MRSVLRIMVLVSGVVLTCAAMAQQQSQVPPDYDRDGGPYVPTPNVVVDRMLDMAKVQEHDHVIDLGSGDGVIVITAGYRRKASGYGVDIDEELVRQSNLRAGNLGMSERVKFEAKDIFQADVSKATVVTLYLLPDMMQRLRPKLYTELRPGTRIVSHDYHFGEWLHDAEVSFDVPEKELVTGEPIATLYLWVVPARVEGAWRMQIDGGGEYKLKLGQYYQNVEGSAEGKGRKSDLLEPVLYGTDMRFMMSVGGQRVRFSGQVNGDRMEGSADFGGGRVLRWRAVRSTGIS